MAQRYCEYRKNHGRQGRMAKKGIHDGCQLKGCKGVERWNAGESGVAEAPPDHSAQREKTLDLDRQGWIRGSAVIPNVCFVQVSPDARSSSVKTSGGVMCGALAVGWISEEDVERLELLGWTFSRDGLYEVPVCALHFGLAADSLNPGELV